MISIWLESKSDTETLNLISTISLPLVSQAQGQLSYNIDMVTCVVCDAQESAQLAELVHYNTCVGSKMCVTLSFTPSAIIRRIRPSEYRFRRKTRSYAHLWSNACVVLSLESSSFNWWNHAEIERAPQSENNDTGWAPEAIFREATNLNLFTSWQCRFFPRADSTILLLLVCTHSKKHSDSVAVSSIPTDLLAATHEKKTKNWSYDASSNFENLPQNNL